MTIKILGIKKGISFLSTKSTIKMTITTTSEIIVEINGLLLEIVTCSTKKLKSPLKLIEKRRTSMYL